MLLWKIDTRTTIVLEFGEDSHTCVPLAHPPLFISSHFYIIVLLQSSIYISIRLIVVNPFFFFGRLQNKGFLQNQRPAKTIGKQETLSLKQCLKLLIIYNLFCFISYLLKQHNFLILSITILQEQWI